MKEINAEKEIIFLQMNEASAVCEVPALYMK